MNKFYKASLFFAMLFVFTGSWAQRTNDIIRFAAGNITSNKNVEKSSLKLSDLDSAYYDGNYYVVIHFKQYPSAQQKNNLIKAGIILGDYIPDAAYFAIIKNIDNIALLKDNGISSIQAIPSVLKIDPSIKNKIKASGQWHQ